jgi:hypothetical protein
MILRCLSALLLCLAPISGLAAQAPDELVLEGENIITVTIAGQPVRLEVSAESFGAPLLNPATVERLALRAGGGRRRGGHCSGRFRHGFGAGAAGAVVVRSSGLGARRWFDRGPPPAL